MCFSPAASFVASGALGAAGAYTLRHAKRPERVPFASIPLIFAAQQAIEGAVWLSFGIPALNAAATYAYVLFSHVLWPVFLPYAVWRLEPDRQKKKALSFFVAVGGLVSAVILGFVIIGPVSSAIAGRSIAYDVPLPRAPYGLALYVIATCGSCLFSSRRYVRVFGLALFGALLISYWAFQETFYSVWCFFAAILSLIVYVHLRQER